MDIGLRVFVGRRSANVSASDIRDETVQEMAQRAMAMARETPEDPYCGLAEPAQLSPVRSADTLELCDPSPEPSPAELQQDAERSEAAARQHKGISQVQSASAGYSVREMHLAASATGS